jgi:peptidase YpeB-like protein
MNTATSAPGRTTRAMMAVAPSAMAIALAVGSFGFAGSAAADNAPPQASAGPDAAQSAGPLKGLKGMEDSGIPTRRPRFARAEDYSSAKDWSIRAENLEPHGRNPLFFPLTPGHRHIFERPDHPDGNFRMETSVLDELEPFDIPGIGKFNTAVVKEEEYVDGILIQRSLNWFAIDRTNNNAYAFGEVSWEITSGGKPEFMGTWRAGDPDGKGSLAEPGMLMPGKFVVGDRYIFDGSKSEAHGGSENMEAGMTVTVPAGTFENCVRVREQNLMDLRDITDKIYCPNVGIVSDTSDGKLIASDALPPGHPGSDVSSFGKFLRNPLPYTPPVAKVTSDQAQAIALKTIPGKANAVEIERKRGKSVFTVEVITPEGQERDVFVDIESGEVVGTD